MKGQTEPEVTTCSVLTDLYKIYQVLGNPVYN